MNVTATATSPIIVHKKTMEADAPDGAASERVFKGVQLF